MTVPRNAVEELAAQFGVSITQARTMIKQHGTPPAHLERDAQLRAEAALARVEAMRGLDDDDIQDAAEAEDPKAELREIVDRKSERVLRAQIGAHASWAKTEDRTARTRNGVQAFNARFDKQVDPDGVLDPDERARRAEHARKAYFLGLALKSAKARRLRKEQG